MLKTFARSILLVVLTATVTSMAPAPAQATSLAPLTIEQITDASTYIVRGTVLDVWTDQDRQGNLWTHARISVAEVLKGPDTPSEVVVDTFGGVDGSEAAYVSGSARFSETEDVLVFLDQARNGRLSPVGMNLGKFTIRRAPGETRKYAARVTLDPREHYDARFLPHPPADHRMYLDELLPTVEGRLEQGWDGKPIPGLAPEKLKEINVPARRIR